MKMWVNKVNRVNLTFIKLDEEMLKTAIERVKQETEQKYEEKIKQMLESVTKQHHDDLGNFYA
jgi:isopropylmalate/homocitrate/citramalate synthase